jgi:hypothetical protein
LWGPVGPSKIWPLFSLIKVIGGGAPPSLPELPVHAESIKVSLTILLKILIASEKGKMGNDTATLHNEVLKPSVITPTLCWGLVGPARMGPLFSLLRPVVQQHREGRLAFDAKAYRPLTPKLIGLLWSFCGVHRLRPAFYPMAAKHW